MVENVKECFLRFFLPCKFVYIIEDQHINHLVKVKKIIPVIVPNGFGKLGLKLIGVDVQNDFVGKAFFYLNTNGMCQVGFSKSGVSVNHQRVKGCTPWVLCYGITGASCQAVAFSFNKILKSVVSLQLGINLKLLNTGNDKRISDRSLSLCF